MLRKRKLTSSNSPGNKKKPRNQCEDEEEVTFKQPQVRRSPNGYILPPPLPAGLKLHDNCKASWILSSSIGVGGFGEIYAAASASNPKKKDFVIKVEPHSNGPLYVEINFYTRCARASQISEFSPRTHLGIPEFIASGSFSFMDQKFRFLVLPRLGEDLEKMASLCNGYFSTRTACNIGIQVIDTLEYIHSHGFVHKDIKGSNLLLHRKNKNKVYLADFGLASRYIHEGVHKPQSENPRMAHEGTLEYTSRDGHMGCVSRRGDIEVLFYNLIEWLGGCLPWDSPQLKRPSYYQNAKFSAFKKPLEFLNSCFGVDGYPEFLNQFIEYLDTIPFSEAPDYNYLRSLLKSNSGSSRSLSFTKLPQRSIITFNNSDSNQENVQPNFQSKAQLNSSSVSEGITPSSYTSFRTENNFKYMKDRETRTKSLLQSSWDNPTPVMLEVIAAIKARQQRPKTSRRSCLRSRVSKLWSSSVNMRPRHSQSSYLRHNSAFKLDAKKPFQKNRELSSLICDLSNSPRKTTRTHSTIHTLSMTPRSLRKQVRDALDMGLGNIAQFLKSLYPFRIDK